MKDTRTGMFDYPKFTVEHTHDEEGHHLFIKAKDSNGWASKMSHCLCPPELTTARIDKEIIRLSKKLLKM